MISERDYLASLDDEGKRAYLRLNVASRAATRREASRPRKLCYCHPGCSACEVGEPCPHGQVPR